MFFADVQLLGSGQGGAGVETTFLCNLSNLLLSILVSLVYWWHLEEFLGRAAVAFVSCHLLIVMHFKYLGDSDFSSTQDATALQHAAMYKERISQRRNRRKGLLLQWFISAGVNIGILSSVFLSHYLDILGLKFQWSIWLKGQKPSLPFSINLIRIQINYHFILTRRDIFLDSMIKTKIINVRISQPHV